ncbi:hypothetical protein FB451DRAFT_1272937 [Mycena latifolia]|nr:hypothetical protein FB451DRAFT_1272937 [Mycena latifolia]
MTEYDYSPGAMQQYQRTQQRIAHWADDAAHAAPHFRSPFAPRSESPSGANEFYRSSSPSPSSSRSPRHSRASTPQRSHYPSSHGQAHTNVRSPLRAQTINVPVHDSSVGPHDSISQVSGPAPTHRTHRRAHSHSPSRHTASHPSHHASSRHRSQSRSGRSGGGAYVLSPGGVQYAQPQQYGQVQYAQPVQYTQLPPAAAYVVVPRDRKVQIVYAEPPPAHHPSFLQRVFGSQSGKHGRSRSLSMGGSRSSSRSRR